MPVEDHEADVALEFPIVCIGASAGGLEPLTVLLRSMRDGCGFAYVVIQHLDPDHPSQLVHLLSQATRMPVSEAADGDVPAPGHVYVIPPKQALSIVDGCLRLAPRGDRSARHLPIDGFLRSLAGECGSRSIAVILSGGGDDGTLGVGEVRAAGGITFAQDGSADHRQMPASAIASGDIDFVLSPKAIADELVRISRHSYLHDRRGDAAPVNGDRRTATDDAAADEAQVQRIIGLVRARSGIDFSTYRTTMIERRIRRRMALRDRADLKSYADALDADADEIRRLTDDLHIGVTGFFRDPEVFLALRTQVLTELVARKAGKDPIRIWVAGCSTGEEAYSLAIEVLDLCAERSRHPVIQIFATDISEAAVARARSGLFPRGIIADVSSERLQRYFAPEDGGYRIDKSVRDLCVFARHNLSVDTPFSRIDLISCRNVLIYFGTAMQERALATFHHALAPEGILLLGSSESVGGNSRMFRPVDVKCRIFARMPNSRTGVPLTTLIGGSVSPSGTEPQVRASARAVGAISAELRKEADRIVLERFGPAGMLVDASLNVIQFRGEIAPYLAPAQGKASLELISVVHPSLAHTLETALAKAREQGGPVRTQTVWFPLHGVTTDVGVEVVPVRIPSENDECYLILLEDSTSARVMPRPPPTAAPEEAVTDQRELPWLRQQLAATKQYLGSLIEQHAIASERMQLAGDDLQSANEELRVTNEEIQSAKEEQESANEELATLLEELRRRNHELNELNDDLTNLLEKITIPVIILDRDLRIRRLTATARTMVAGGTEVGRSIADLKHSFHGFDIEATARQVVQSGTRREAEVCDQGGAWRLVRVFPYEVQVGTDRHIHGAVITVQDIDRLKRSEIILNKAAGFTRSIVETIGDPIVVLDHGLRVVMANRSFHDTFHASAQETVGRPFAELCDGEWGIPELIERLRAVVDRRLPLEGFQVGRTFPATGYRMLTLSARHLDQEGGASPMVIVSMTDLTEHMRLEVESRRFKFISERSSDCHVLIDHAGRYAYANRSACGLLASTYEDLVGMPADEVAKQWPGGSLETVRDQARQAAVPLFEAICHTHDGRDVPVEGSATALDLGGSHFVLLSMRDISARKQAKAVLAATAEELRRSNAELERFAAIASHDLQEPLRMITGYLSLVVERCAPALDDKARAYLGFAADGAKRLTAMIQAILQYARFECGDVREPVDLGSALDNALANLKGQIADTGAEIIRGAMPTLPVAPNQIDTVFQNLISNALKYAFPGRKPRVVVKAEETESGWTISVADNGSGIDPRDFTRVFDLFQRLNPKASEGSGIGLATTKKIIEHQGGNIWLTSVPGEGSVFFFNLLKRPA